MAARTRSLRNISLTLLTENYQQCHTSSLQLCSCNNECDDIPCDTNDHKRAPYYYRHIGDCCVPLSVVDMTIINIRRGLIRKMQRPHESPNTVTGRSYLLNWIIVTAALFSECWWLWWAQVKRLYLWFLRESILSQSSFPSWQCIEVCNSNLSGRIISKYRKIWGKKYFEIF